MRGRITGLAVILLLAFGLVLGQAIFIQVRRANALDTSPNNPRVAMLGTLYPRGEILTANGTVLARSIPTGSSTYPYRRGYPLGSLFSDVVGFVSTTGVQGAYGLEAEYETDLIEHAQPAESFSQLFSPARSSDTLVTTLSVPLQRAAARALAGRDGAVVAIDPRNGAVLALYSNPTYNPAPMTSLSSGLEQRYFQHIATGADAFGFHPLSTMALQYTFPPGSTFKVVTTAAILRYDPSLATYSWGPANSLNLSQWGSDKVLYNAGGGDCGGTIQTMLPESCDPGYAYLGIQLGPQIMFNEANQFGFDAVPPIDLPDGEVQRAYFPPAAQYKYQLPQLGYSAIGQWNVRATALEDALVAAGIADNGKVMAPHLMKELLDGSGDVIQRFQPYVWRHALGPAEATETNTLMQGVAEFGTAQGIFPPEDHVGAKTGTAQTFFHGVAGTDDWMIAFAPANDPVVAVAVVLPYQAVSTWGATVAGPVMNCVIQSALALHSGQPTSSVAAACP